MDTIYMVAFYTPEIKTSGGPESIYGLPGMILGLALPHEHITWFAKEISLGPNNLKDVESVKPESVLTKENFQLKINALTKNWGSVGPLIKRRAFF